MTAAQAETADTEGASSTASIASWAVLGAAVIAAAETAGRSARDEVVRSGLLGTSYPMVRAAMRARRAIRT